MTKTQNMSNILEGKSAMWWSQIYRTEGKEDPRKQTKEGPDLRNVCQLFVEEGKEQGSGGEGGGGHIETTEAPPKKILLS